MVDSNFDEIHTGIVSENDPEFTRSLFDSYGDANTQGVMDLIKEYISSLKNGSQYDGLFDAMLKDLDKIYDETKAMYND